MLAKQMASAFIRHERVKRPTESAEELLCSSKGGNSDGRETSANKLNNLANRATTIDTNGGCKVAI